MKYVKLSVFVYNRVLGVIVSKDLFTLKHIAECPGNKTFGYLGIYRIFAWFLLTDFKQQF